MDRNLRYKDLLSTMHEMIKADRNGFVYEMRSLLNASGKTINGIEKANGILEVYVTVKPS